MNAGISAPIDSLLRIIKLKFWHNPRPGYRSDYLSGYDGHLVFGGEDVCRYLFDNDLEGQTVMVTLGPLQNGFHPQSFHRFASLSDPDLTGPMIPAVAQVELEPCHLIIDGQNLLGTLKDLHNRLSIFEVIQRVEAKLIFPPREIRFFICEDELQNYFVKGLLAHPEITVVPFPKHVSKTIVKRDADPYVLSYLGYLAGQKDDKAGLVLFAGDMDYAESLRLWLGIPGLNYYRETAAKGPVKIVSSLQTGAFSPHLMQIAGHENVSVSLLERIIL